MVEPIFKEPAGLEIETETQMAIVLQRLLFWCDFFAAKSFILMYLDEPRHGVFKGVSLSAEIQRLQQNRSI